MGLGPAELLILLVGAAIVVGFVVLMLAVMTRKPSDDPGPRRILEERLARGDISPAEFDELRARLQ